MRADLYPVRGLVLKAVGFDCVGGREGGASNGVSPITDAPLTLGVWTPPPPPPSGGWAGGVGSFIGGSLFFGYGFTGVGRFFQKSFSQGYLFGVFHNFLFW